MRVFHQKLLRIFPPVLLAIVYQGHQVVGVARVTRDQIDEEPGVLRLLHVEVDHGVQVGHLRLHFRRHLSDVFEHVRENAALVGLLCAYPRLVTVDLGALGLQAPSRIKSHQRGSLRLYLVDVLASHLVERLQLLVVLSSQSFLFVLALDDVLLRRDLLLQDLMLRLLRGFGHEIVLPQHLFSRFKLAGMDQIAGHSTMAR